MVTAKILLYLFAAIPAGLLLIWLGWRGRRINQVPNCRQCTFDLTGVWPASVTCPECGAGLKQPKMVVTGQRRRMWLLIAPGVLGVVLPGLALATALFLTLAGKDVYKYKPVNMLLWEGRNASPEFAKAAAKELTDRLLEQKLTEEEIEAAVKQVLELQGDVAKPWFEEWGAFIEQARLDGSLSAEQKRLFRKQAGVLELVVRPRVRAGDPLPVGVRVKECRVGPQSNFQLMYQLSVVKYTADDASLPLWTEAASAGAKKKGFFDFLEGPEQAPTMPMGYGYLAGSDSQYRQWQVTGSAVQSLHKLRASDELGVTAISVECLSTASQVEPRGGYGTTKIKKDDPRTKHDSWSGSFEIVAADQETVEMVPESETLKAQMLESVTVSQMQWYGGPDPKAAGSVNLSIAYTDPKVPMAMVVIARFDGKETVLGEFTTSSSQPGAYAYANQKQRWVSASVTGRMPDQVDIILRPRKDLAAKTPDLVKIYGGELLYEKVAVNKPNMGNQGTLPILRLFGF